MAVYGATDIVKIRESGRITARAIFETAKLAVSGVSTLHLDNFIRRFAEDRGAKPAFLGQNGFPASLCVSLNNLAVHGVPSGTVVLKDGDILKLDFGVIFKGWYSDSAITLPVGKIDSEAKTLIDVTKEALTFGIKQARPGNHIGDISFAIQSHVEKNGFEVIRELTGHGLGRKLHEPPQVPNFGQKGKGELLREGMVIAIEPITAVSSRHIKQARDGHGLETSDGSLSAHFEHTVVITRNGPEVITALE